MFYNKEELKNPKYMVLLILTLTLPLFLALLPFLNISGEAFGAAYVIIGFIAIIPLIISFIPTKFIEKLYSIGITFCLSFIIMIFYLFSGRLENILELLVMAQFYILPYIIVFAIGNSLFFVFSYLFKKFKNKS